MLMCKVPGPLAIPVPYPPPSTQQGKGEKKRKPDYQFAVIHDALYPLHVIHQPPQPAVKMLKKMNKRQ